jgi:ClpP class serine protease
MSTPIQITIDRPQATETPPVASQAPESQADRRVSAFDLVAATPWAITPDMLDTIRSISLREGEGVEAVQARLGRPLQNTRSVTLRGSTAIVPVTGPIFRYANLMTEISGATSLDMLAKDFTAALDNPTVSAIVLDINSPGGQVTGISEFAALVRAATKPVVAYVDGMAASAAYWIAAAASDVVMSKSAMAGNVGAVLTIDKRKDPTKAEIVSSQSPNKRPDAETDSGLAQIQSMIDGIAQVFIEDVAIFRGKTPDQVINDWNGGAVFIGAEAVARGLADRVGTMEEVIAGLAGKHQSKPATPQFQGASAMNLEELRAAHPDLCCALVEEGRIAGAAAERQRILDIESQALPGHEALIAQLKADGKTTGAEAATAIVKAEREICADRARQLSAGAQKPVDHAAAPVDTPAAEDKNLPVEERAKAKWDSDAALRAEFQTLGAYTAYLKNHEAGRARVLGAK